MVNHKPRIGKPSVAFTWDRVKLNKQPSSLSPLVQLAGIRKCFDGKEVIPQLDLTINNGEFLTLLGLLAAVKQPFFA